MEAILSAVRCQEPWDPILECCGSFRAIVPRPKKKKGGALVTKEVSREQFKAKIRRWAEEHLSDLVRNNRWDDLRWKHAIVYLYDENYFHKFCRTFGGAIGENGWYKALQTVFGLTREQISEIRAPLH